MKVDHVILLPFWGLAVLCWVVVGVFGLRALRHRRPERTIWFLGTHFLEMFDEDNFLPEAAADLLRFRWATYVALAAMAIFFVGLVIAIRLSRSG